MTAGIKFSSDLKLDLLRKNLFGDERRARITGGLISPLDTVNVLTPAGHIQNFTIKFENGKNAEGILQDDERRIRMGAA